MTDGDDTTDTRTTETDDTRTTETSDTRTTETSDTRTTETDDTRTTETSDTRTSETDDTRTTEAGDSADDESAAVDEDRPETGPDPAVTEPTPTSGESRPVRGVIYPRDVSLVRVGAVVLLALFVVGLGAALGYWATTGGGEVTVESTTIETESGLELGATVYEPANASVERPAPAVVLVHGYTGDRRTMESFAIEFAARDYVVVTVDQPGHGSSDPPAFADGWGGPATLEFTRSLEMVDENRIALVGHSMGGFATLTAASDQPDGYASVALLGSTWGPMDGVENIPEANETFPRNMAVIYSPYDEFSRQMWSGSNPGMVPESEKLAAAFDADPPIEPGYWYGSFDAATARMFTAPRTLHTGMHLSPTTIADTIAWVTATTGGPPDPATENQRWQVTLTGQALAFLAGLVVAIGTTTLVWVSRSSRKRRGPDHEATGHSEYDVTGHSEHDAGDGPGYEEGVSRDHSITHEESVNRDYSVTHNWPLTEGFSRETLVVLTALPALTFYPLYAVGTVLLPVTGLTPQELTHGFLFWALGTLVLAGGIMRGARANVRSVHRTLVGFRLRTPRRPELSSLLSRLESDVEARMPSRTALVSATVAALAGFGGLYLLVALVALVPGGGFQLWMVGFDTLSPYRWLSAVVYVGPFTVATVALSYGLARATAAKPPVLAIRHALALTCGGLGIFLLLQYVPLILGFGLPAPELGPLAIRALRATLLLAVATVTTAAVTSLTDSPLPGGICAGLLVTWLVVVTEPLQVAPF